MPDPDLHVHVGILIGSVSSDVIRPMLCTSCYHSLQSAQSLIAYPTSNVAQLTWYLLIPFLWPRSFERSIVSLPSLFSSCYHVFDLNLLLPEKLPMFKCMYWYCSTCYHFSTLFNHEKSPVVMRPGCREDRCYGKWVEVSLWRKAVFKIRSSVY